MIKTLSSAVRALFASALVEVCEAIDENFARWAKRRVDKQRAKQRMRTNRRSRREAGVSNLKNHSFGGCTGRSYTATLDPKTTNVLRGDTLGGGFEARIPLDEHLGCEGRREPGAQPASGYTRGQREDEKAPPAAGSSHRTAPSPAAPRPY